MKGHVPTPSSLAERMVRRLFRDDLPTGSDRILYPGCGDAPIAAAVERVCSEEGWELPTGYAVETNPEHLGAAIDRGLKHVEFAERDFLANDMLDTGTFEFIIGNPPYVPIEDLNEQEKERYRSGFKTAIGRFDLYLLFFERSLELLAPAGTLSLVTTEKFEYVDTAAPLRRLLTGSDVHVEEIEHIDSDAFKGHVTFPCISTVRRVEADETRETRITLRNGSSHTTILPGDGESWAAHIRDADLADMETGAVLGDVTNRISPGLATGADAKFVMNCGDVPEELEEWVRPTVGGRQLREHDGPYCDLVILCPYRDDGSLAEEEELGAFGEWAEDHRDRLEDRSCVENGKAWYAWHENPPMKDLLRPKIVFQDITKDPKFWHEKRGDIVPKHSVYYLIPKDGVSFDALLDYLNSSKARIWMEAHCQKAHNGYLRLQSRVLKDLPVPKKLAEGYQSTL